MSFRNGDKSREHRIRKARQRMREKIRKLQAQEGGQKQSSAAGKK